MKVSTCRAATAAARNGLNVMSAITTRPSSDECCHPEGGGTATRVIFWFRKLLKCITSCAVGVHIFPLTCYSKSRRTLYLHQLELRGIFWLNETLKNSGTQLSLKNTRTISNSIRRNREYNDVLMIRFNLILKIALIANNKLHCKNIIKIYYYLYVEYVTYK